MADALKPKSFRIDDATADKFKEISAEIGGNQQETLAKLIEAYEFQSGKAILTEKKADIEQFEKYINALTRMFMGSLEDNQNISETVRTEFDALLISKDATIRDLQAQLTAAKQQKEESTAQAKAYAEENARLSNVIDSLNNEYASKMDDMQSMLADKDSLNKALTDSCNDLKAKVDSMQQEHQELVTMKKELASAKSETKALEQSRAQSQMQLEKATFEIERKYQEQIQVLKEQKQKAIDEYQQKYLSLLEKLQSNQ